MAPSRAIAFAWLACLWAPAAAQAPVPLPTRLQVGLWLVRAQIAGHERWLIVSTASPRSALAVGVLTDAEAGTEVHETIRLGQTELSGTFRIADAPEFGEVGVAGVLGRDVLRKIVFGFDLEAAQLVLWPEAPRLTEEESWATEPAGLSGDIQHASVFELPGGDAFDYAFAGTLGGKSAKFELDSGAATSEADPSLFAPKAGGAGSAAGLVLGAALGDLPPFWFFASAAPAGESVAKVVPAALPTRRILLDGPAGRAVFEQLGPVAGESVQLGRLLGAPLEVIGRTARVGAAGALYGPDVRRLDGAALVSLDGRAIGDWLDELDARPAEAIERLDAARRAGLAVVFVRDGRTFSTTLRPAHPG